MEKSSKTLERKNSMVKAGEVLCIELVQKISNFLWEVTEHRVEAKAHLACADHILPHECPPSIMTPASSQKLVRDIAARRARDQRIQWMPRHRPSSSSINPGLAHQRSARKGCVTKWPDARVVCSKTYSRQCDSRMAVDFLTRATYKNVRQNLIPQATA